MESNRPNFQEPVVIQAFEPFTAWYTNTYHAERWSTGYDLREWLVGIIFDRTLFQLNLLCFWIQIDIERDDA